MFEFRNARFANPEETAIDVEINHPRFGWIPFTATPDDTEAHGREIFNAAIVDVQPYEPPVVVVTADDVGAERDRRLALGFSFNFGDERGAHRFGTTPRDWIGWDRVTKMKDALFQAGDSTTTIHIDTETGGADVTGPEWNGILLYAAATFEQPLWQASFILQAMSPIPLDYATNAAYWPPEA